MAAKSAARARMVRSGSKAGATATDVKRLGWRGILDLARRNGGQLKVTNHNQTQGVVLTPEAFEALVAKARSQESALERSIAELSAQFDQRLAGLEGKEGASRLRAAIGASPQLRGKVKAGTSH